MRKNTLNVLKFIFKSSVSCLVVFYLALTIDWASLGHTIKRGHPGYYTLSLIVIFLSTGFLAAKCRLLIEGSSIRHSFLSLVKINIVSRFYSLFLPPAVGPEMVRWFKITRNQPGKVFFMAASLFERAGFIFISLLAGAVFLYFSPSSQKITELQSRLLPLLLLFMMLSLLLHAFFLSKSVHQLGHRILEKLIPPVGIKVRLLEWYSRFFLDNRSARLIVGITSLSIGWHLFFLVRNFLLFLALSIPLGFLDVAWISSLVFLLQLLPVSLAGIGVREGAFAYMFIQVGLPPEQGVAVGVLFFSQFLLVAALGGVLELLDMVRGQ